MPSRCAVCMMPPEKSLQIRYLDKILCSWGCWLRLFPQSRCDGCGEALPHQHDERPRYAMPSAVIHLCHCGGEIVVPRDYSGPTVCMRCGDTFTITRANEA